MKRHLQKIVAGAVIVPFIALTTAGCATSAKNVAPSYVSPLQYQTYTCEQIGLEVQRIATRVGELTGQVDDRATKDAWAMGIGIVLFWPALFFLSGGNSAKEAELSRMKGEYDALQQAAIQRTCVKGPPPTTTSASAADAPPPTVSEPQVVAALPVAQAPVRATPQTPPQAVPEAVLVRASAPVGGASKYMFNAERHAKSAGCVAPIATMTIASPAYEVFAVACQKGTEPLLVRCDYGVCKTLQ